MTVENDLIASPILAAKAPLLPEAARQIAHGAADAAAGARRDH